MTCDTKIVRGNIGVIVATFALEDGTEAVVSSAWARVAFKKATDGTDDEDIVSLSYASGQWTGEWDTTPAAPGWAYWFVESTGIQAASQGKFLILANDANAPYPAP